MGDEHTAKERRSLQKLLRPLNKLFPDQASTPLPSTLKTTQSDPLLPTEAQYHPARPHTPPNAIPQADHLVAPAAHYTPDGSHRLSVVDLIPGPLTSTLSSPLSAIVADSLRRGVDVSSLKPRRRRKNSGMPQRSGLRQRGNSETDTRPTGLENSSSSSLPTDASQQSQAPEADVGRSRVRSLSNTFGDLFRNMKRPRRGSKANPESNEPSEPPTPGAEEPDLAR